MAPPKSYKEANPTVIPFETVYESYIDNNGNRVVVEDYRPRRGSGYEILTDDVLNSGNLQLLNNFRKNNQDRLNDPKNAPAKRYLDARIKNAQKIQAYENRAKLFTAQRRVPPKPQVFESGGYIGMPSVKYPEYQTSSNGCWSIAYSTLLKSRGVDLSQEEIRQWRPDYKENARPEEKANKDRKVLMNTDAGNSIYTNADLVGKVLPNTAVSMLHLEPFNAGQLSINGKELDDRQELIVQQEYLDQAKEKVGTALLRSFSEHQSPVAVSLDGHYITITGISPDHKTIRYEDSLGAENNAPRTRTMSMNDLIEQGMLPHWNGERIVPGNGLELTWLSDLPVSENKRQQELDPDSCVKADRNGNVTVSVPGNAKDLSHAGSPNEGQVTSNAVEQLFVLDQTKLSEKLGGVNVEGWGAGKGILFGSSGTSYPGRVMRPGDKTLLTESAASMNDALNNVSAGLDHLITNRSTYADGAKVTEFKYALREIQGAAYGRNADMDKARQTLAGMYDFLLQKPKNSGKTHFENGFSAMSSEARRELLNNLNVLNDSLALGRGTQNERLEELHEQMNVEAQKKQDYEKGKRQYLENMNDLWKKVQNNGAYNNKNGSKQQEEMHSSLAMIAANHIAYQKNLQSGREMPFPSDEQIAHELALVERSESFRDTVKEPKAWMTDKSKKPLDFINDLGSNARRIADERKDAKRYETPKETWGLRRQRLQYIAATLIGSRTGSYTDGGFSRSKNSDSFEDARKAISDIAIAPVDAPPAGKDIKKSVDTVLKYLDGKEKKRTREFGQHRWNDCMKFLAETMPREDFEVYCAHVNEVRGVKPGHADYVGPESFYPNVAAKYVIRDSVNRIATGNHTMRDFARIIAMQKIGKSRNGVFQGDMRINNDKARAQLCAETQRVMEDPRFTTFLQRTNHNQLLQTMSNDASGFSQVWETYKTMNPVAGKPDAKAHNVQPQPQAQPHP